MPGWLRLWAAIQSAIVGVCGLPAMLGLFGYGLAHASDATALSFALTVLVGVAVLAGLPVVCLTIRWKQHRMWVTGIGLLALLVGSAAILRFLSYDIVEPAYIGWKHRRTLEALSIVGTQEQPVLVDGQVIGLRVAVDVRVPHEVRLDRYGKQVKEMLSGLGIAWVEPVPELGRPGPFDNAGPVDIRLDGVALDALPSVVAGTLPAGVYRSEQTFWLAGIVPASGAEQVAAAVPPCLRGPTDRFAYYDGLARGDDRPMKVTLGVRYSLEYRRGYGHVQREAPLEFRYRHAAWTEARRHLAFEDCELRERRIAEEARAKRYAAGDLDDLHRLICNGDVDGAKALLALGAPRRSLASEIRECTLDKPRPDMLDLLMPIEYRRGQQGDSQSQTFYCKLLGDLHDSSDTGALSRLLDIGLPLQCGDAAQAERWRNGFEPTLNLGRRNPHKIARPTDEAATLGWLKLMQRAQLPICARASDGTTLLQLAIRHHDAEIIDVLLDARCDPHARPPDGQVLAYAGDGRTGTRYQPILPVAGWTLRKFRHADDRRTTRIEPSKIADISRRMGDMRADEINRVDPVTHEPFLVTYREEVLGNHALLLHLVARGARLDVVNEETGRSWFDGVDTARQLVDLDVPKSQRADAAKKAPFEVLDHLSDAQMRQLLRPKGKPLSQLEEPVPRELGLQAYLCKRRLRACAVVKK